MTTTDKLEKMVEKLENINYSFKSPEHQSEFDSNKEDVIDLLNSMVEYIHEDDDCYDEGE